MSALVVRLCLILRILELQSWKEFGNLAMQTFHLTDEETESQQEEWNHLGPQSVVAEPGLGDLGTSTEFSEFFAFASQLGISRTILSLVMEM